MWDIVPDDLSRKLMLPTGRPIRYWEVLCQVYINEFGVRQQVYGGRLTNHLCQATARDLLAAAMRKLETLSSQGVRIVGHVHDEIIMEVPEAWHNEAEVERLMTEEQLPGLPLAVEMSRGKRWG